MLKGFIYKCTNLINNKVYVGQTIDIERRWEQHIKSAKSSKNKFYDAIKDYGEDNFNFEILEEIEAENKYKLFVKLSHKEIDYIEKYNSCIDGYNTNVGGGIRYDESNKNIGKLRAIFGYTKYKDNFIIVEKEKQIILDICNLIAKGYSGSEVAQKYNKTKSYIYNKLSNIDKYNGQSIYPKIIDDELYKQVKFIIDYRIKNKEHEKLTCLLFYNNEMLRYRKITNEYGCKGFGIRKTIDNFIDEKYNIDDIKRIDIFKTEHRTRRRLLITFKNGETKEEYFNPWKDGKVKNYIAIFSKCILT